jgi:GAF domain-containing protein
MAEGNDGDIAQALVEFARGLSEDESVHAVLEDLGDSCADLLSVDGVGVLLLEDRDLSVATTNNPIGDTIEQLEAELHEGPCVDCVRTGQPVFVEDLRAVVDRYPNFAPRALEAGARAIHALPLTGRGELLGALDIVNRQPLELSAHDLATAQMLADVAVSYIFAVRLHEDSSKLATQLQHALNARVIIEQAKGMLAERHGMSPPEAFEVLRRHARSHNMTVREVSAQTIDGLLQL